MAIRATRLTALLCLFAAAISCSGGGGQPGGAFKPIDPSAAVFWDRQATETGELIRKLTDDFNRDRQGLRVKLEHAGGYSDIFRKVTASIRAGSLPSMAVAYQSMTAEYAQAGAVVALEGFVNDPEVGLSKEDLDDFFPVAIETNKYPAFGGKMYSFPFCKSVLMLYFNKRVLGEAGFENPPKTWDEFLEQCRGVKAKTGKFGYAVSVDCSTIAGMIFSMGGEIVSGNETLFDSPQAMRAFGLIETLAKETLAYQVAPRSYDDEIALAGDEVAFVIRSSSGRTAVTAIMQGDLEKWGMTRIPQDDPDNPSTVLFGPNICIFNTTPEQQRAAWDFVKYFTSPETSVRWALGTGYLPIRKSVADNPKMKAFWDAWEYNRAGYDCLPFARSEPNLTGWQEVRGLVEGAETAVLTGMKSARKAAIELKQKADAVLARQ